MDLKKLTIVSRKSRLALQQSAIVKQELLKIYPNLDIEILGISTKGDETLEVPLNKIGGKGLFVTELEEYLLQDKADIAVHSLKDIPTNLAAGLGLAAILKRADPRDVFVSPEFSGLEDLPAGSIVGTSSLRRQAQVLAIRKDVKIESLRGNVETRLQKLLAKQYSAIILAAAGLERLGLTQWLKYPLDILQMLPAVGQGVLGIEYKLNNNAIKHLLTPLNDSITAVCVQAERAMNAKLDGGCQAPIAGLATIENNLLTLRGLVAVPDGSRILQEIQTGSIEESLHIGEVVAERLLAKGAGEIIAACKHSWNQHDW